MKLGPHATCSEFCFYSFFLSLQENPDCWLILGHDCFLLKFFYLFFKIHSFKAAVVFLTTSLNAYMNMKNEINI